MQNKFLFVVLFSSILIFLPSFLVFSMGYRENEINGNNLYKQGDFEGASVEYTEGLGKKADYDLYYNRGVSYYKLGQYDKSFSDFEDAATYANSGKDQIKAVYNAGNSNYMLAETLKSGNPAEALEYYGKAVNHFERVLQLDAENSDASYNLELSRVRLDELKQQQNEEPQDGENQSDEQQNGNEEEGDKQDQNQQDSGEQNSEQQNSEEQNAEQQQDSSENPEQAYLSEEISPKDILNEEARRQEARQLLITNGSVETVDRDW